MAGIGVMNYNEWIGREVDYISASGKHHVAIVRAILDYPLHSSWPMVRLTFQDHRNKNIIKERVLPRLGWTVIDGVSQAVMDEKTWAPLEGGRQLWERREDGKDYFCDLDGLPCGPGAETTNLG